MLSSFSLISLVGVLLGVLVLVVVMAVYAGMERDVKGRLLGFTPHVLLKQQMLGQLLPTITDWEDAAAKARQLPGVVAATPYVSGMVLVDNPYYQRRPPAHFQAVDTNDAAQVRGIDSMLARDAYPGSSADMGLDDRVVVSSVWAENHGIQVGDSVRLISSANVDEVIEAYNLSKEPPLREAHAEVWEPAARLLAEAWQPVADGWTLPFSKLEKEVYEPLSRLLEAPVREVEKELVSELLTGMQGKDIDEEADIIRFSAADKELLEGKVAELNATDQEKMDVDLFRNIERFVLPREATVIGVYQATMMAITPDLFVPLHLGQDLAGTEDGVQGVALRLKDPYQAAAVAEAGRRQLGPDWALITWGEQYQAFFSVINQQRVMLYFALSFIVLVSAFSMMAVMFTVTIQKRREIGVMKALGAAPGQIVRVFLYQGMLLGVLGAVLGVALGRVVIHFRGEIQAVFRSVGFDPFSMVTGSTLLPAFNDPLEQAVIAVMGFVLCSLAAFVPAFFAARSDAAKSLRNL